MRKILFICLLIIQQLLHAQDRRLLFIGIDGCRPDAVEGATAPNLHQLIDDGVHSVDATTLYPTWSGNGWSTMVTGVNHAKHNVINNSFTNPNYEEFPDFITRAEAFNPALNTYSIVHWDPINILIIENCDNEITVDTDVEVMQQAVEVLTNEDPHIVFLDFDDVDAAGHSYGFHPDVLQYKQAIELMDLYILQMRTALEQRPNYESENWLIVVTTDHGGIPAGHGGGTYEERNIFVGYWNENLPAQEFEREILYNEEEINTANFPLAVYAIPQDQDALEFGATQDFTIELWVKANGDFEEDPTFISNKDWDSGLNPGWVISAQQSAYWKVNIGDGTNRADLQGGFIDENWHHLAVSFDRDGWMKMYEDGILVSLTDISFIGDVDTGLPVVINQDGTMEYGYDFDGYYRDIRVWNTVIPQDIILSQALAPVDETHPYYENLLANWLCNDGSGSSLTDSSPNGNNCIVDGDINWSTQTEEFFMFDHSDVPKEEDNAVTALTWLCVPIDPEWNLDGVSWVEDCGVMVNEIPSSALHVFPNPATDILNLKFDSNEISQLQMFNALGKMVLKIVPVQTVCAIDVSALSSGVYLLKSDNGYFEKIVIE